jgi:hypothetical protein
MCDARAVLNDRFWPNADMSITDPGCVKTPPLSDGRRRLQMQRDMPLTSLGGDNALSVSALASSENLTGLKAILSVPFYVFTQPGPTAVIWVVWQVGRKQTLSGCR